jgi:hypothetical protein
VKGAKYSDSKHGVKLFIDYCKRNAIVLICVILEFTSYKFCFVLFYFEWASACLWSMTFNEMLLIRLGRLANDPEGTS